jgi:aspartyl/glutamyl-tRNA(Asn/Gln) amidotransferase C subunit
LEKEELEHIAQLAALGLEDPSLTRLAEEIGRILEYVSELQGLAEDDETVPTPYPGPRQPLRLDEPQLNQLPLSPSQIAPAFRDGLFQVPSPNESDEDS